MNAAGLSTTGVRGVGGLVQPAAPARPRRRSAAPRPRGRAPRPTVAAELDEVGVGRRAVDLGLAAAEPAEVGAVEDQHARSCRPPPRRPRVEQRRVRVLEERRAGRCPSSTTNRSRSPRPSCRPASRRAARGQRSAAVRRRAGRPRRAPRGAGRRPSSSSRPAEPAELGGEDHADRDGVAVPPAVVLDLLDRVAERVAVVEDLAQPRPRAGRARHDVGLHRDRALDQLAGVRPAAGRRAGRVGLDQLEDRAGRR